MDIMDIQAVESKLSDVTVTPIPRSQVQNFYNFQHFQREKSEQQPQIQISAIRSGSSNSHNDIRERDLMKRERGQQSSSASNASAVAALQYSQLQAQLALLQQQANTTASLASSGLNSSLNTSSSSSARNISNNYSQSTSQTNVQAHLKYPQSTSPIIITTQTSANITTPMTSTANLPSCTTAASNGLSKYSQLLQIIEEMGRDIRPTYTGSRSSTERLKRGIVHARILVRECLMETEHSARK